MTTLIDLLASPVNKKRKFESIFGDKINCCICLERPSFNINTRIETCENGHFMCDECKLKLRKKTCAMCRSRKLNCKNLILDQIINYSIDNSIYICNLNNCTIKCTTLEDIKFHEKNCTNRNISCFNVNCFWNGKLNEFINHLNDNKICGIIIKSKQDNTFKIAVNNALCEQGIPLRWNPTLLIQSEDKHIINSLYFYINLYRTSKGELYIYIKSYSPIEVINLYTVKITCLNFLTYNQLFTFVGKLHHYQLSEREVMESGQYLYLIDHQIKMVSINKSFNVIVEIIKNQTN